MLKISFGICIALILVGCGNESVVPPSSNPAITPVILVDGGISSINQVGVAIDVTDPEGAALVFDAFSNDDEIRKAYDSLLAKEPKSIWLQPISAGCFMPVSAKAHVRDDGQIFIDSKPNPQESSVQCIRAILAVGLVAVN